MTTTPKLPQTGGAFVIGKDGKLVRDAGTAGPLDPEHEANRPAASGKEKGK